MAPLAASERKQIERTLGRALVHAELVQHASLDELDDRQREVARQLAKRQLVSCTLYLRALVPIDVGTAVRFMATLSQE